MSLWAFTEGDVVPVDLGGGVAEKLLLVSREGSNWVGVLNDVTPVVMSEARLDSLRSFYYRAFETFDEDILSERQREACRVRN